MPSILPLHGEGRSPVSGAYSLPDGHYRLTVDTGNGTSTQDKHKMFWVQCASETPSPTPTETESPTPTPTPTETESPTPTETTSPTPTATSSESSSPAPTTSVPSSPGGPTGTSPAMPTPTSSPGAVAPESGGTPPTAGGLAFTGSSTVPIAGLGLALVLAGVALLITPAVRRRLLGD